MAELMFRMLKQDDLDTASNNQAQRHRAQPPDPPVACMEEFETVAGSSAPPLWRNDLDFASRFTSTVTFSGTNKSNMRHMRMSHNYSEEDQEKEPLIVLNEATPEKQDSKHRRSNEGISLSDSLGAQVSTTIVDNFDPQQNNREIDPELHAGNNAGVHRGVVQGAGFEMLALNRDNQSPREMQVKPAEGKSKVAPSRLRSFHSNAGNHLLRRMDNMSAILRMPGFNLELAPRDDSSHVPGEDDQEAVRSQRKESVRTARTEAGAARFRKAVRKVMARNKFAGRTALARVRRQMSSISDFGSGHAPGKRGLLAYMKSLREKLGPRRLVQLLDRSIPIVNPSSKARRSWDLMILAFVIYNAIAVPVDAGFAYVKADWLKYTEVAIDITFVLDILYNFRTAYIDSQGNVVRDSRKITRNYIYSWFAIDAVASIPFDWFAILLQIDVSDNVTLLAFLKTPRLLRLARLLRFLERVRNANVFRIVRLMAAMCLIAHWIACIWHFLFKSFSSVPWIFTEYKNVPDAPRAFLIAYYNSFVLMMGDSVGPQNDIEYAFCCVVLVIGACFMAVVVGNMAFLVSNMNVTAARHRTKMDMIKDALRYFGMPDQIQERVQEYFDYLSQISHPGPEGMAVLGELPTSMYEDICAILHVRAIRKVPPFKDCEEPFIMQLVTCLTPAVYMPGETIFRGGDVGHEMYLISKGKVAVINRNEEIVAILNEGSYFGELALLATARRVATCASLTHCDLNVLNSTDLQATMRDFPVSAALVKTWAVSRLADLKPVLLTNIEPASQRVSSLVGSRRSYETAPQHHPSLPSASMPSASGPPGGTMHPDVQRSQNEVAPQGMQNIEIMMHAILSNMQLLELKLHNVEEQIQINDAKGGVLKGLGIVGAGTKSGILNDQELDGPSILRTMNGKGTSGDVRSLKQSSSSFNNQSG